MWFYNIESNKTHPNKAITRYFLKRTETFGAQKLNFLPEVYDKRSMYNIDVSTVFVFIFSFSTPLLESQMFTLLDYKIIG